MPIDDTRTRTPARLVTIDAAEIPNAMRRLEQHEARMKALEAEEAEAERSGALPSGEPDEPEYDEHGGELNPTPERLAEIEAAQIAEAVRRLNDLREGRVKAIPWEEAMVGLFDPPTPEELAEMAAEAQSRRARR